MTEAERAGVAGVCVCFDGIQWNTPMCRFSVCGTGNATGNAARSAHRIQNPMEGQIKQGTLAFALAHARQRGFLEAPVSRAPPLQQHMQEGNVLDPLMVRRCSISDGGIDGARRRRRVVGARPISACALEELGIPDVPNAAPSPVSNPMAPSPVAVKEETAVDDVLCSCDAAAGSALPLTMTNPLLMLDMHDAHVPAVHNASIPRVPAGASKPFWSYLFPRIFNT